MSIKVCEQGEFSIEITPPLDEIEHPFPINQPNNYDIHYLFNKSLGLSPNQPTESKNKNLLNLTSLTPAILPRKQLRDPKESVKNKSFEEVWNYMLRNRRKQIN